MRMKAHKLWNVKEPKDRGTTEERKKNNVTCVYGTERCGYYAATTGIAKNIRKQYT